MSLRDDMTILADRAVAASRELALLNTRKKNAILKAMAGELDRQSGRILSANRGDVEAGRKAGLSPAMVDRLMLDEGRVAAMARGLRDVAALPDPVGRKLRSWARPNGLRLVKISVPIGVIAVIYESRPNVTADAAALCFKASNAVILRGGSEAIRTSGVIVDLMLEGGMKRGLPGNAIQLVRTADRDAVGELVRLTGKVDLAIPRGGEGLIRAVTEQARVPVIKHYKGVCHVYVDESADADMALRIIENAKCQRPGVCNAAEKVLVHERIAPSFLPGMAALLSSKGVELRGDAKACAIVPGMKAAAEQDWHEEYLALIMTVGVVPSVEAAVDHIMKYGSRHSDAIVASSEAAQEAFVRGVDSAAVYVNASTRFTDGGEFGMGAEIGISTDKLHARGPMGLAELTTYKYVVRGNGQVRG